MPDRFPLADLADPELEQMLTGLGPYVFPATPDLAGRVRSRLEREPAAHSRRSLTSTATGRRSLWLAVALLLIALLGALALFPETRSTIADRLGLRGVLIEWVDETPTPGPPRLGAPLMLGRSVTLDEAQKMVDFSILVPTAAGFDAPVDVYLLDEGEGNMVSFVYAAGPGLPASDATGVGALLTQFRGEANRNLIEKGLVDDDGDSETRLEAVTVGDEPGFWISGAPHGFFFVCFGDGECREERYRLAGDVLLWEQDGLTVRLESALSLEDALTIAESMRIPK
jgi:hypothetical protein